MAMTSRGTAVRLFPLRLANFFMVEAEQASHQPAHNVFLLQTSQWQLQARRSFFIMPRRSSRPSSAFVSDSSTPKRHTRSTLALARPTKRDRRTHGYPRYRWDGHGPYPQTSPGSDRVEAGYERVVRRRRTHATSEDDVMRMRTCEEETREERKRIRGGAAFHVGSEPSSTARGWVEQARSALRRHVHVSDAHVGTSCASCLRSLARSHSRRQTDTHRESTF